MYVYKRNNENLQETKSTSKLQESFKGDLNLKENMAEEYDDVMLMRAFLLLNYYSLFFAVH